MISGGEQIRRLLVFHQALWEARKVRFRECWEDIMEQRTP